MVRATLSWNPSGLALRARIREFILNCEAPRSAGDLRRACQFGRAEPGASARRPRRRTAVTGCGAFSELVCRRKASVVDRRNLEMIPYRCLAGSGLTQNW